MLINTFSNSTDLDPDPEEKLRKPFHLEMDEHFNNIEVNIQTSTVQVPTNVYNQGESSYLHQIFHVKFVKSSLMFVERTV